MPDENQDSTAQGQNPDPATVTGNSAAATDAGSSTSQGGESPKDGENKPVEDVKTAARGGNRARKNDPEPDVIIGTIRTHEGKEYVKVGPGEWVPVTRLDGDIPPPDDGEKVKIRNKEMAGQKIFLGNGKIVEFDKEGIIEVGGREAARLSQIPGYEKV
jgi:hypothetical protein